MKNPKRRFYLVGFVLIIIVFVVPILYRWYSFAPALSYQGYTPPEPLAKDEVHSLAQPVAQPMTSIEDGPGMVLFDAEHADLFMVQEKMIDLVAELNDRGHRVEYFTGTGGVSLEEHLRAADAFVLIAPHRTFNAASVRALQKFVERGGRLLLVADPTQNADVQPMNSLAGAFGIIYQNDYIYNVVDNAGSFRDVIFRDFADSALVDGVEQVAFFTAHPIRAPAGAFIFGDEQTYAAKHELPGGVTAAVQRGDVVALPDKDFLTAPYNRFADNARFIDNLCDWLVGGKRSYILTDFPYFLAPQAQIVFTPPVLLNDLTESALQVRDALTDFGVDAHIYDIPQPGLPTIKLGLYSHIDSRLMQTLHAEGIAITSASVPIPPGTDPVDASAANETSPEEAGCFEGGQVYLEETGTFDRRTTSIVHLIRDGDRYELIVLAPDETTLVSDLNTLLSGDIGRCALTDRTAFCRAADRAAPVAEAAGPVEVESGVPSVLVVSEADSSDEEATKIAEALSLHFEVTVWSVSEDGVPSIEDLSARDAVIWAASGGAEALLLMQRYVGEGGRLFLTGAHIGKTCQHSDLYMWLVEYKGEGTLAAMEVMQGMEEHPLAEGFSGETTIIELAHDSVTDVIEPIEPMQAVFSRALESYDAGRAAVIAGVLKRGARVVYATLPMTALPDWARERFVLNVANWLIQ